ncbi:MAG: zinc-binding dehydrogenase, partial [Niastella sp.]|uniref:zinc-binding dehydrogenase n=1 Tax=Niastella sp. TaxID=1869183 RepID=UPI00389B0592
MEMLNRMRAIVTDPDSRFKITECSVPVPAPHQALIRVTAFSLNQGEVRTALAATTSYIPGWDFAGVIIKAASNGNSPKEGTRVFGFVQQGAWAEYIVAAAAQMATTPDDISDAQAASLPVAAGTAVTCMEAVGPLLNLQVLITGAAGGVGRILCQLTAMAGAKVFAVSRRPNLKQQMENDGVMPHAVFTSIEEAKAAGKYDVVFDSIGGHVLAVAVSMLTASGTCVNFGNSSRQPTTFNVRSSEWPFHRKQLIFLGPEVPADCTAVFTHMAGLVKQ